MVNLVMQAGTFAVSSHAEQPSPSKLSHNNPQVRRTLALFPLSGRSERELVAEEMRLNQETVVTFFPLPIQLPTLSHVPQVDTIDCPFHLTTDSYVFHLSLLFLACFIPGRRSAFGGQTCASLSCQLNRLSGAGFCSVPFHQPSNGVSHLLQLFSCTRPIVPSLLRVCGTKAQRRRRRAWSKQRGYKGLCGMRAALLRTSNTRLSFTVSLPELRVSCRKCYQRVVPLDLIATVLRCPAFGALVFSTCALKARLKGTVHHVLEAESSVTQPKKDVVVVKNTRLMPLNNSSRDTTQSARHHGARNVLSTGKARHARRWCGDGTETEFSQVGRYGEERIKSCMTFILQITVYIEAIASRLTVHLAACKQPK